MKIDIITIFPEIFENYFSESMIKIAREKNLVEINIHNLRDYAEDKHQTVDARPFGGGAGMVMMIEPIHKAIQSLRTENSLVIATVANGKVYKQSIAKELSTKDHLIILCGHYGGIDFRVLEELVDMNISIGYYVLTGGELPAMVIVDSIARLIPGVLGNDESAQSDSFYNDDITPQYPIYTRPAEYDLNGKILKVPNTLLSGNHKEIENWRENNRKLLK